MSTQTSDLYPNGYTYGKFMAHVFAATSPYQMRRFYDAHCAYLRSLPPEKLSGETPEAITQQNIGYLFGNGLDNNPDLIAQWKEITGARNPYEAA